MKTILKTTIFFFILFLIFYFSANYVLKKLSGRIISELQPRLEQQGIIIRNFDYSNVHLTSYNSCTLKKVDLDFYLNRNLYGKESFSARFNAESISLRFADFENPSFFFTFEDFRIFVAPEETSDKRPFGKLDNGYLKTRIPLYLKNPEESAREILNEVRKLFRENKTPIDLEIDVDALLGIDSREVKVGLFTQREGDITYLKFEDDDIYEAAKAFEIDLAEKEAEIIANYPSKVPAMIKITRDAKRLSKLEKDIDPSFPEDAFRHIFWSYHLSREFGPELAKEISDAHETIPGNTAEERHMDYHNNAIGIQLAQQKMSLEELKHQVLNSREIIRNPEEIRRNR
ncbi:MAG: hypothetical protein MI975_14900 [Cytophagales bacterium]|nr:hypothetical protein [Cytophagales bacterium]